MSGIENLLSNRYSKIYYNIINKAISDNRTKGDTYYERHHIIPRALGGLDYSYNLVLLTAREHYICHWLLIKMVRPGLIYKMQFAFFRMCSVGRGQKRTITSAQYDIAKKHNSAASIIRYSLNPIVFERNDEVKAKMRAAKKDKVRMHHKSNNHLTWVHNDDVDAMLAVGYVKGSGINAEGANNAMYGRTQSEETRKKIGDSKRGKKWNGSIEGIARKSEYMRLNNPNSDPVIKAKNAAKRAKTFIITHADGREETVTNMAAYCRANGLHPGNMTSVAKGNLKHYKGMVVRYA